MDLLTMRTLFEAGALRRAKIVPVPMEKNAWMLSVERKDGKVEFVTVVREARYKIYKSLGAAQVDIARIGFSEATLQVA